MNPTDSNLRDHGKKIMNTLEEGLAEKVTSRLAELDEGLANLITDYAFGSVLARDGLDLKTRQMLTVASLITMGNAMPQLALHMRASLNVGVTPRELLEIIIQMSIYAGVPACMNALTVFRQSLQDMNYDLTDIEK